MGRAPCCDKANVKKGPWSPEEDAKLKEFIDKFGTAGNWIALPQKAGLKRCGKSCRLRWLNYLRPNIKHGEFSEEEDRIICSLFANIGSRWSIIAAQLPGRTDNDIKNYWNTKLKKKLIGHMISSSSNQSKYPPPFFTPHSLSSPSLSTLSHLYTSLNYHSKTAPISPPQNFLYPTTFTHPPFQHPPEGFMDLQNYPSRDVNMLAFGHAEASSSSDGSCSYGKEAVIKQEEMGFLTNFGLEESPKFAIDDPLGSILDHHKTNGLAQLQYDIEEVKQLITACDNSSLMVFDESKRGERELGEREGYYY